MTISRKKTLAITGGNGFIGSAMVSYFAKQGYEVISFERIATESKSANITRIPFYLEKPENIDLSSVDVLIHTAYQPVLKKNNTININIIAAKIIAEKAERNGTKVIFISTLSAHDKAESIYGKTKLEMEKIFNPKHDLILRLGLVIGDGGGLFGKISNVIKKSAIVPLIGGSKLVQTISLNDVCLIIDEGISRSIIGTRSIAYPEGISFRNLYREMARIANKHPVFIPIPIEFIYYILLCTEALHIKLPFTTENVLGLRRLLIFDVQSDLDKFGVKLKNSQEAIRCCETLTTT